jgi:Prolyl oligopeptidase family
MKRTGAPHSNFRSVLVFLTAIFLLNSCRLIRTGHDAEAPPDLIRQVQTYLRADELHAGRLLTTLSSRPFPELESAVRLALEDSFSKNVPTGSQPSRSVPVGEASMKYGLYVPSDYDPSRSYPMILCLHGAGFNGDTYLGRWQPRLGGEYILACPTIQDGAWWTRQGEELVLAVLSEVTRNYHVDPDRVYLTGMSNGGVGTFLIGLNHSDRFAALVPMAGALPVELFPLLDNARNTPMYLIHGSKDQVMPVQSSRDVAAYLERKGFPFVYREHDRVHPMAGGHYFPKEELPDLMSWLKTRRRTDGPGQLSIVRDRDHPGREFWVRIDEIDPGTASFQESENKAEESERLRQGDFARLDARLSGNTIYVTAEHVRLLHILIGRNLVNLEKPLVVFANGRLAFEQLLQPDGASLLEEARRRPDPRMIVYSSVKIRVVP